MLIRGIDVGIKNSYFADVKLEKNGIFHFELVRYGRYDVSLPPVDKTFVEVPSPRNYRRNNTHILLKLYRIATAIYAAERNKNETEIVEFEEWASVVGKSRSAIDTMFVKMFGDVNTNQHVRDAAVIAATCATRARE